MASLTLRDIPEAFLEKARAIAARDRRSLNQALILLLEQGLKSQLAKGLVEDGDINKDSQIGIWRMLAGKWKDRRTTKKIVGDIYKSRTSGRYTRC